MPRNTTSTVTDTDAETRPLISALLAEHAKVISEVKQKIQDDELYKANSSRYDDIWILRYSLSHKKNVRAASKAALSTMKFREEYKLNEIEDIHYKISSMNAPPEMMFPAISQYLAHCEKNAVLHTFPDDDRGVVSYYTAAKIDSISIGCDMTVDDIKESIFYLNECIYRIQDEVTRRTGRLTKQLKIVDLTKIQLRKLSRTYVNKDADANKMLEDHYPQLVGTLLVANSPGWVSGPWNMFRGLFPRRLVQKVDVLPRHIKSNNLKGFLRYISLENLPERFGGQNKEWPTPCAWSKFQKKKAEKEMES